MEHDQPLHHAARRRYSDIPERWIMIDQRLGDRAAAIVAAMPPRSAVVIRPYAMAVEQRAVAIRAIVRAAKARRHLILWGGRHPPGFADGVHGGGGTVLTARYHNQWLTLPVHNRREAMRAARLRATAVLISPVSVTATHPSAACLGRTKARQLVAMAQRPAIALGGMNRRRFQKVQSDGFVGWAAIDAWIADTAKRRQKRKRVPT